jgi:hypothetical protein
VVLPRLAASRVLHDDDPGVGAGHRCPARGGARGPATPRCAGAGLGRPGLGSPRRAARRRRRAPRGHRVAECLGPPADGADRGPHLGGVAGVAARPGAGPRQCADGLGRCAVLLDLPLALAVHRPR